VATSRPIQDDRTICLPFFGRVPARFRSETKADSIGKFGSSDVTSTLASCSNSSVLTTVEPGLVCHSSKDCPDLAPSSPRSSWQGDCHPASRRPAPTLSTARRLIREGAFAFNVNRQNSRDQRVSRCTNICNFVIRIYNHGISFPSVVSLRRWLSVVCPNTSHVDGLLGT
jgi:hypothetical protein